MGEDRGQTAIDFVVAMGVFFIAIAFVFAFVPSMFAPFFGMGASDALMTDRSAAYLAENKLAENPNANALNGSEVQNFFEACDDTGDPGAWLTSELGVDTDRINVTIGERSCGLSPGGSETVSNRIVTVNGSQERLRVVAW